MFTEGEHPRDKDGKFTEKGGGSSKQGIEKEVSEYKAPKGEGLAKEVSDWAERKNTESKYESKQVVPLPDEQLPFSVGAKWANKDILMPDGRTAHFVEGSKIINKQVFAGKGTKTPIRDIECLIKQYPNTKASEWQKVKGRAELDLDGETFKVEIHWYEEPSFGKVEIKYKKGG